MDLSACAVWNAYQIMYKAYMTIYCASITFQLNNKMLVLLPCRINY